MRRGVGKRAKWGGVGEHAGPEGMNDSEEGNRLWRLLDAKLKVIG